MHTPDRQFNKRELRDNKIHNQDGLTTVTNTIKMKRLDFTINVYRYGDIC